uniref:Uncharacterized protein n=1 Tax=Hucho hucho TaxID=62062 RepID=A0A4W5KEK6_9TELE
MSNKPNNLTVCVCVCVGLLQSETGQVVLAGDPKQLGPILRSPLALKHGMGVSLLERLMKDVSLYQKEEESGAFNNCYVTKLLRNYRYVSSPDQAGLMRPVRALLGRKGQALELGMQISVHFACRLTRP